MKHMQTQILSTISLTAATRHQPRAWSLLKLLGWGMVSAAGLTACADEPAPSAKMQADRQPIGKADADSGTCESACGGQSDAECWCDESCAMYGDCCSDYTTVCGSDAPALCEATGGAWEDGGCECRQDAAAMNMNYSFDPAKGCVAGDPIEPDAPALCEATGGAWVGMACDCEQDGSSIGYIFNPATGCGPDEVAATDDKTLCENTGGYWNVDVCECAQDGASLFFVFQAEIGCAMPDDSPLRDAALNVGAQIFFSDFAPAEGDGVYVIDRPGVADFVTYYKNFGDALDYLGQFDWVETVADAGTCSEGLQTEIFPSVDCDLDNGMTPSGCHFLSVHGFERVSYTMETLNEYGFASYTAAEIAQAMDLGDQVLRVFIDSRHGVTFAFRFKDGAWRLVLIDVSRYSCSA